MDADKKTRNVTDGAVEEQDEEEEAVLEEVLRDVALIEAALANSSSSLALDAIEIVLDVPTNASDTSFLDLGTAVISAVVPSSSPPLGGDESTRLATPAEAFATIAEPVRANSRWQPEPFEYTGANPWTWPSSAGNDGSGLRHDGFAHDDAPPTALVPMAAVCVLLLLLSSWSQLRRSRRRVLERQEDAWLRDVDLVESAYHDDQSAPTAMRR